MKNDWKKTEEVLKKGGVAVIPTDTLYGVVGSSSNKKTVKRIHELKDRSSHKPFIILISSLKDLEKFDIKISKDFSLIISFLKKWPRKTSIILPCDKKKFEYLHYGKHSLAFRLINKNNKNLYNLIKNVGPIVAPSANTEGQKPAETVKEARNYFGDNVDMYLNSGRKVGKPSTILKFENGEFEVLR